MSYTHKDMILSLITLNETKKLIKEQNFTNLNANPKSKSENHKSETTKKS